ncbi:putative 3-hydroxyisobutyryl-CoA hydrolase [Rosa chinensis]|uniref:3-hydroxyisobutyryl-CoA hydrolase n=1 Tax=Rosa chinensis TaxID=74649 RepID=A0A2P6SEQ0_ROSCH|nr:putative 3-hydroxyisobutyryl-CoA hydrolase [Rosa chinensis]
MVLKSLHACGLATHFVPSTKLALSEEVQVSKSLQKASPTSLKLCLRSIREGRFQGLGECLAQEYRIACHLMRGKIRSDFRDGCTTILSKKDNIQKWEPCKLELITDQMVDQYFLKLDDDENLE